MVYELGTIYGFNDERKPGRLALLSCMLGVGLLERIGGKGGYNEK